MRTILTAAILAATASAQTEYVVPPGIQNIWGSSPGSGTGIAAFFSSRVQYLYRAPLPTGSTIQRIGFRGRPSTVDVGAYTVDGEMTISSTVQMPSSMSTTFASNRGLDQAIVLPRQTLNVAAQPATRRLDQWITFPLQTPFLFGSGGETNLNVEVVVYSTTSSALLLDRCFASANGSASGVGQGCGGATSGFSGVAVPGSTFSIEITGAVPGLSAWLLGGGNMRNLGPVPLPFDLGLVLGMTGCNMLVDPTLPTFRRTMDATGSGAFNFPVPATTAPLKLAFQWFYQDPSAGNPLSLQVTDAQVVHIGPRTCPDSQYLFSTNPNAGSGFLVDGGVSMQIIAQ